MRKCPRILIEEPLDGPLGTIDVFDMMSKGSNKLVGKLKAIAFVDVNAEGDVMKFAETVAFNRGLPLMVFSTVGEAEKWLLDDNRGGSKPA